MKTAIEKMVEWLESGHDNGNEWVFTAILDKARRLAAEEDKEKHKNLPQRQDSTQDQLVDVMKVANKMGCYDAADVIRRIVEKKSQKPTATAAKGGVV